MLNEYIEFKEYTIELKPQSISNTTEKTNNKISGRYNYKNIIKLNGLNRIFTILARGIIHHEDPLNNNFKLSYITQENIESKKLKAKKAILSWISVPNEIFSEIDIKITDTKIQYDDYFNDFPFLVDQKGKGKLFIYIKELIETLIQLKKFYLAEEKKNEIKTIEAQIESLKSVILEIPKLTNKLLKSDIEKSIKLMYNDFSLETIILQAIADGPLKVRYLEIRKEGFIKAYNLLNQIHDSNPIVRTMLFLIAYYNAIRNENNNYVKMVYVDLQNWTQYSKIDEKISEFFSKVNQKSNEIRRLTFKNNTTPLFGAFNDDINKLFWVKSTEHVNNQSKLHDEYLLLVDIGYNTFDQFNLLYEAAVKKWINKKMLIIN